MNDRHGQEYKEHFDIIERKLATLKSRVRTLEEHVKRIQKQGKDAPKELVAHAKLELKDASLVEKPASTSRE
ncbi:hypothetical protein AURDEDRAFT_178017 [Auricularia subglabra TFB-10046 SS5]|uniref:Uncharacterized protein n=1 Tax=Auricularia subglabra (strain TFB-10046 / SS5) TaxID=717982 RepID=J0CRK0_AURST|nr:hypothetical protein AURDEDRAFT_178017 [Auricularia subglabra TFB-10046 SS5]